MFSCTPAHSGTHFFNALVPFVHYSNNPTMIMYQVIIRGMSA